jgi:hypothetical protein
MTVSVLWDMSALRAMLVYADTTHESKKYACHSRFSKINNRKKDFDIIFEFFASSILKLEMKRK